MIDKLTNLIGVEYLPARCEREFDSHGGGRSKPTNEFVSHRGRALIKHLTLLAQLTQVT